jgi:hypothetical protein
MFVSALPHLYAEILSPNMVAFTDGAFGRWLEHEGGTLVNGISTLIRDKRDVSLTSCEGTGRKSQSDNHEESTHQLPDVPVPWSWTSQFQNREKWECVV